MGIGDNVGGRGYALVVILWFMSFLGIFVTILRLYGSRYKAGKLRLDFYLIALAVVCGIASDVCTTAALLYGLANHDDTKTLAQAEESLKWVWLGLYIGIIATYFAKAAILALLVQLHGPKAKKRRIMLWVLAIVMAIIWTVMLLTIMLRCRPISKAWYLTEPGNCPAAATDAALKFSYFQGVISAIADVFLSLYPITMIWNMRKDRRTKIGLFILLAGGVIPSMCVIVRTTLAKNFTFASTTNPAYDFAAFMLWAAGELWTLIILSSIPPLHPFYLRWMAKSSSSPIDDKSDQIPMNLDTYSTLEVAAAPEAHHDPMPPSYPGNADDKKTSNDAKLNVSELEAPGRLIDLEKGRPANTHRK